MHPQNPYAPPTAEVADVVTAEVAPPLWNPTAAASWSLLFSPIFGAFLHMRNWEALGQPERAAKSRNWMTGSIIVWVVLTIAPFVLPQSKVADTLSGLAGLGLLIGWYYAIGKSQQVYVAARFGKTYPRRGWAGPLLVAVGAFFAFIVAMALLGVAAAVASGAA